MMGSTLVTVSRRVDPPEPCPNVDCVYGEIMTLSGNVVGCSRKAHLGGASYDPYLTKYTDSSMLLYDWNGGVPKYLGTALRGADDACDIQSARMDGDLLYLGKKCVFDKPGVIDIHARNEGGPSNWGRVARLEDPGYTTTLTGFGRPLAASNGLLLAGSPTKDQAVGAAYLFGPPGGGSGGAGGATGGTGGAAGTDAGAGGAAGTGAGTSQPSGPGSGDSGGGCAVAESHIALHPSGWTLAALACAFSAGAARRRRSPSKSSPFRP
jgi:hypothetical protein